jgi:hypothetical protein
MQAWQVRVRKEEGLRIEGQIMKCGTLSIARVVQQRSEQIDEENGPVPRQREWVGMVSISQD